MSDQSLSFVRLLNNFFENFGRTLIKKPFCDKLSCQLNSLLLVDDVQNYLSISFDAPPVISVVKTISVIQLKDSFKYQYARQDNIRVAWENITEGKTTPTLSYGKKENQKKSCRSRRFDLLMNMCREEANEGLRSS